MTEKLIIIKICLYFDKIMHKTPVNNNNCNDNNNVLTQSQSVVETSSNTETRNGNHFSNNKNRTLSLLDTQGILAAN
jgi:hypothetical protein